jgi:hypothetical protein
MKKQKVLDELTISSHWKRPGYQVNEIIKPPTLISIF